MPFCGRGQAADFSIGEFLVRELAISVLRGQSDRRSIRIECLDDGHAGLVTSSTSAADLRDQLERPFRGAEVGKIDRGVGIYHTNQSHAWVVEALGDHLGSKKDSDSPIAERVENGMEILGTSHGVGIDSLKRLARHEGVVPLCQGFLDSLSTQSECAKSAAAGLARAWYSLFRLAMMASNEAASGQIALSVHDHGRVALIAFEHPAASSAATCDVGRETSSVEKKDRLPAIIECSLQRVLEHRSKEHRLSR